jgi:uncharacterized protein YprB with RNaseH-like and TPR domain
VSLDDLRKRLGRLGVVTGAEFKAAPAPARPAHPIEQLIVGQSRQNSAGQFFETVHPYASSVVHGPHPLEAWFSADLGIIRKLANLERHDLPDPRQFVFLDTETTGLGGAGAIPFLVGIGVFTADGTFEVRQYFLRNPAEEEAMLDHLHEVISADTALVTFNGRSFDQPLLAGRYVLARRQSHIGRLPNFDLLSPARSLWRRLPSRSLGALEVDILGLERTGQDVPGSLIPYLYHQYMVSGDAREMARVFYHNEQDILSMVTLAVILCQAFGQPDAPGVHILDRLSMARWLENRGQFDQAETAYRLTLDEAPDAETRHDALVSFGAMLKRLDRRPEAVPLWLDQADLKFDVSGHEELAKYYEWYAGDIAEAIRWTETGITLAESWRPGLPRTDALRQLNYRRERLLKKLSGKRKPAVAPPADE